MMTPPPDILAALSVELGGPARFEAALSAGDINQACRLDVGGQPVFLKWLPQAPKGFYAAEARGLGWLDEAGVAPVAQVLHHGERHLALRWIERGPSTDASDEALGRGLAALHASLAPGDPGPGDNFIGRLRQDNRPVQGGWAAFYRQRRLWPQIRRATAVLGPSLTKRLERLAQELEHLLGPPEPMARLHGDLWSANHVVDTAGVPWLIDPAAAIGHREMDLAMMQLFGGYSERVFAAYGEAAAPAQGWQERLWVYQLYYLLVHVNLFGSAWVGQIERLLRRTL